MAPILDKEELKKLFLTYLGYYYDLSQVIPEKDLPIEARTEHDNTPIHSGVGTQEVQSSILTDSIPRQTAMSEKGNTAVSEAETSIQVEEKVE